MIKNFIKAYRVSVAGIRAVSTVTYMDRHLKQDLYWPLQENSFDINIFALKTTSDIDNNRELHNGITDLWLYFAENHGGVRVQSDCLVNEWLCTSFSYTHLKNMLLFWLRNRNLIQKGLIPVTNPIWLQNNEGYVVKLTLVPKVIEGQSSPDGRTIVVKISSKQNISRDDFEETILFFMDNYDWVGLRLGKQWKIIRPSEDIVIDSDNWVTIELEHPFK
jgi:hypothetical protein